MSDDTQSLLEQAQAIQKQKMSATKDDNSDLLKQAQAIQDSKMNPSEIPNTWTPMQSAGQGALQGATGGFSDELGGVMGAAMEKGADLIGKGTGDKKSLKELYQEYRDMNRGRNEQAQVNPGSYLAGNVGGALGTAALTGGLSSASNLGKVGQILQPAAKLLSPILAPTTVAGAAGAGALTGLGTSQHDLTEPSTDALMGTAKDVTIGGTLGAVGGAIGKGVGKALNPEKLEVAGSKMAQEAMGMNSSKDLTSRYNPMTGRSERGSDIIKGTGTTAIEQDVLKGGSSNWYDNAIFALDKNNQELSPLLQSAQQKIDPNVSSVLENVSPITTKTPIVMQGIFDEIPQNSQKNQIVRKISQQYSIYEQKLGQADGNLPALNAIKQELTSAAENLSPQVYTSGTAKTEADLYKRMAGVVRQHIEDLASSVDSGSGDQIHQVNKNIGNLINMLPALKQTTRGGIPTNLKDVAQKIVGPVESSASRLLNATSKGIKTPAGQLVQKALSTNNQPIQKAVISPFTQEKFQDSSPQKIDKATKFTTSLYNATDDSLKAVASKFKEVPGLEFYADHLNKAIDTDDVGEKNRAIFVISQNARAKKLLTPDEDVS